MSTKSIANRHGSATVTLQGDREIVVTRKFDAPAELIWKAWNTPELVKRWWGFPTSQWQVCEIDLRVGGRWRYVIREGEMEVGFHGVYQELDRPRRLVSTEVYEGFSGGPDSDAGAALNTITLEEEGGVTTMTTLVRHEQPEHRDAHIGSGMESGLQVSYDRMEDVVRELGATAR
jgi:uncharacterized protein YndB with AHSA1/START domain